MLRLLVFLFVALPAVAQVASDADLCSIVVRRHASTVCRTNVYGNEDCTADSFDRVCAYTIINNNGVETTTCQTCIASDPPPGPYQDDCQGIGESGAVSFISCDSPIIINPTTDTYSLSGPENT